jgi:hypothetical protein
MYDATCVCIFNLAAERLSMKISLWLPDMYVQEQINMNYVLLCMDMNMNHSPVIIVKVEIMPSSRTKLLVY